MAKVLRSDGSVVALDLVWLVTEGDSMQTTVMASSGEHRFTSGPLEPTQAFKLHEALIDGGVFNEALKVVWPA